MDKTSKFIRLSCLIAIAISTLNVTALSEPFRDVPWEKIDEVIDNLGTGKSKLGPKYNPENSKTSRADLNSGATTASLSTGNDAARAVAIQTDGKIILGGKTTTGTKGDFAIVRFNADGSVDTSFASSGIKITTFGSGSTSDELIHALAIQKDGRIVAVGKQSTTDGSYKFALARFTTDGFLDTTFFTSGKKSTAVFGSADIARAIAIETSGKLLVGGYGWNSDNFDSVLARYTSDGNLDTSFVTDGTSTVPVTASDNFILGISIQTDGKAVVASAGYNGSNFDFYVLRYETDGTLDTSFNTIGKTAASFGTGDDSPYSVEIQTDGKIILAGSARLTNTNYAVARFTTAGKLDTSFYSSGLSVGSASSGDRIAYAVKMQNESILVGGKTHNGTNWDFGLMRFRTDGALDTSFNTTGVFSVVLGTAEDSAQALALLDPGYAIIAGRSNNGTKSLFGFARFQTDGTIARSGDWDVSFGSGGKTVGEINANAPILFDIKEDHHGGLIVVGVPFSQGGAPYPMVVSRYRKDGSLDTTYSSVSQADVDSYLTSHVTMDPEGRALVTMVNTTSSHVLRFQTDGSLDVTFATSGVFLHDFQVSGYSMPVGIHYSEYDGKILSVAHEFLSGFSVVNRLLSDGTLDTSFGTGGVSSVSQTQAILTLYGSNLDSSNRLLVTGSTSSSNFMVRRLTTGGDLDTSFNTTGELHTSYPSQSVYSYNVYEEPKSKTIVIAGLSNGLAPIRLFVARLRSDGVLDTSFRTDGVFIGSVPTIWNTYGGGALAPGDRQTIVTGASDGQNYVRARLLPNGTLDTTFSTAGELAKLWPEANSSHYADSLIRRLDGRYCFVGRENVSGLRWYVACFWP